MRQPDWIHAAIALGNRFHYRSKNSARHNTANVSLFALLVALAAGVVLLAPHLPAALYVIAGGFVLGVVFFAMIILVVHEASHDMFVVGRDRAQARTWNRRFGWAVSVPFGMNYTCHWEQGHLIHHLRPMEAGDPQNVDHAHTGRALIAMITKMLLIPGYAMRWNPSRHYQTHRWLPPASMVFWLVAGGLGAWRFGWQLPGAFVVAFGVLGALNQVKSSLEHGGALATEANRNLRTRTSLFPLRWLLMPLNISLHFEHHLNYCVPWYDLPRYQRALREIVPLALQPELFNERIRDQLMGRMGRIPGVLRQHVDVVDGAA